MKSLFLIFILLIISACSFDNKTGIWKDASDVLVGNKDTQSIESSNSKSRFEDILIKKETFNEEKNSLNNFNLDFDSSTVISNWLEEFGAPNNNISNISYDGNNILASTSRKLSRFPMNNNSNRNIIFYNNNLISYDQKGKIFIYSIYLKKKIFEYNFYKKKFKNIKKEIFLIVSDDILYVSDNLGYLYAINLKNNSLVWAKNYGIPFRSNLKIVSNQLFLANQDNVIYSIDIKTGDKQWQFATSITFLKSDFKNNFALEAINNNLFFLNTSGELYSINYVSQKINWIYNFKASSLSGNLDLFLSHPLVLQDNNLVVSTENSLFQYNSISGIKNWGFSSGTVLKPVLTSNYTYILSKNDLLICIENKTGDVLWSQNIYKNLKNSKMKIKIGKFYDFKITNKKLNLFSANGYLLSFNYNNGNLNLIKKISKNGIRSKIVFFKNKMFLINNKNKLLKFN